jgi:hypothetical protein
MTSLDVTIKYFKAMSLKKLKSISAIFKQTDDKKSRYRTNNAYAYYPHINLCIFYKEIKATFWDSAKTILERLQCRRGDNEVYQRYRNKARCRGGLYPRCRRCPEICDDKYLDIRMLDLQSKRVRRAVTPMSNRCSLYKTWTCWKAENWTK